MVQDEPGWRINRMNDQINNLYLNSLLCALMAAFLMYLFCHGPLHGILATAGSINIPSMAISLLVFFALFLSIREKTLIRKQNSVLVLWIMIALFLIYSFAMEKKVFDAETHVPVEQLNRKVSLPFLLGICLVTILTTSRRTIAHDNLCSILDNKNLYWLFTLALVVITFFQHFNLNFTEWVNNHHLHAYLNSILNCYWGQPFTINNSGIYGHYAYFYVPFMKLFATLGVKNLYVNYSLISCLISVCVVFIWAVIIDRMVTCSIFRYSGLLCAGYIELARRITIYHQLFPHRSIVVAMMALLITLWYIKQNKNSISIIGYLLTSLFIIWNVEYGLVALLTWSGMHCCRLLSTNQIKRVHLLKTGGHLLLIPGMFLFSFLLCNIINVLMGGSWLSIEAYVFPLMNHDFLHDTLEVPLPSFPSAWISLIVFLFSVLGVGISGLFRRDDEGEKALRIWYFGIAVLGIGSLTYAINRPAYGNFTIVMGLMGMAMTVMADRTLSARFDLISEFKGQTPASINLVLFHTTAVCVMTVISISCLINIPYKAYCQTEYKNKYSVDVLSRFINHYYSPDAVALGKGASNMYAYIGKDPNLYLGDFSNMGWNYYSYELMEKSEPFFANRAVFLTDDAKQFISSSFYETHVLVDSIAESSITIEYYRPR